MAKQLNVSLAFTANTNEAIAAIKKLQKELNELATGKSLKFNGLTQITPEIQKAMVAAGELQAKLEAATNVQTGKLDLSQFSDSLKKGGVSLQQYATQLNALGPAGRQAFTNLASAIMQAEAPLMRCSQRVKELGTSLANTARWQLSSSILHGFMGAVQSAYGYAKDLNESLNDIRIVTGASVAEMDAFAAKANKAAKALSTTTNEYAKASLIYFQQGDNQEQAMSKASVTAKMANVTGQSAEVVSNQLTAIWNNFNKAGDVSYEHYADVLTKLGAATASSTDEIAGGLEKFAGIADQIGLSYEYAASALATITATSRESEDVVGTALKTIFARIQGLSLGETLDDGTNLNKYSEALQKVGVSIFDQAGELKDMDDILEEMADKWKKLSRDQQTALAQTVAGVRQYNQLMTLMNNWDVMDRNLVMANSADGELNKQHEIYAEGWEAASDRVRASAEKLYTQVLNDDFFIDFLNGVSKAIDGVSSLVDAFGGLKGVLFTVGAFATTLFQKEITKGLKNAAYNLKQLTPLGKKEQAQTKTDALNALQSMKSTNSGASGKAENSALSHEVAMQQTLMANAKALTDEEVKQLQIQMDLVRSLDERAVATAKLADASREELETLREKNRVQAQMDAKMKVRADAKHTGETNFAKRALKAADTGGRKTLVEQYYKQQKHAAEAQVRQTHGLDPKASLQGFESEVQEAFVNGIRQAAQADGASEIAQKVGKELEHSISMAMSGVSKRMSQAMADARKEVAAYDQQIDKAAKASASAKSLGATKQTSAFTGDGDAKAAKSAKELAALQEVLKTKISQTRAAAEQLAGTLSDSDMDAQLSDDIAELQQMEAQLNKTGMEAKELQEILDRLNAGDSEGFTIDERIQNTADVAGGEAERDGTANTQGQNVDFTGQYEAAKKRATTEISADDAEADSNTQMQMFDEQVEGNSKGVKNWASDISNATSVVMGLGSAITSIQGAINVFSNPDATGWDKFSAVLSVIIGITSALPPILNLVGTSGAAAGAGMTAAMGPVGWILLAIVAAITAIVAAFSIWDACTVSAAEKTERLTENVQKMKEAASDAKEEAEGLKDAFDEYKDVKSTLEECTVGTTEWKTAMEGVKGAIDGILEAYPGLAKVANVLKWDDKTQSYILDEEKVNEYIQGKEDAANAAVYGSQMAEGQLKANESEKHITEFDDAKSWFTGSGWAGQDGFQGLSVQNLTGNRDLDRKTIEEAMKNDILAAGWLDMSTYGTMDANGNMQWNEGGQEQFEADMQSYYDGWNDVIDSMLGIAEVYHGINDEANTIFDTATKTAINDKFGNQGLTEAEMNAAAKATEDSYDDIYTELYGTDGTNGTMASAFRKGNSDWESLSDEGRAILERYEKAVGEDITWDANLVQGNDANRTFHIQGQEEGIKPEEIAATIAAYEALGGEDATDAQKESMNVVKEALGGANDIGDAFITAITKGGTSEAMTDFLSNLTPEQTKALVEGIDPETGVLTEDALATLGISPEQFAQLADMFGITVEELSANLTKAGENVVTTTEHLHDNSAKAVQEASKNFTNLSVTDQRKVGNLLQDSYMHQGEDVMNNLSTVFQNAGDDAGALADIISGIDWTSDNAVYDLNNALAQQGISVSQLGPEWDAYVTHMTTATTSVYTFISALDTLRGKMASINDITDGLEFGGVISDEDYETLLSYNKEIADMFTMTADGWKFIGDIDTLNSALETSIEDVGQFKEEFSAAQNAGDVITNYAQGWKMEDGSYKIGGDYMKTDQQKALAMNTFLNEDAFGEGTFDPIIEASGYSREALGDAISTVANATEADKTTQAYQDALAIVESFYGTAQGFIDDYTAGKFEETAAEELWVNNQIKSLDDLEQAYKDGEISLETYGKMQDSVFQTEVNNEGFDYEEIDNYADSLKEVYGLEEDVSKEAALYLSKMSRGVDKLSKNWSTWSKNLDKSKKGTAEYAKAFSEVQDAVSDLLDIDASELGDSFFESAENLELLGRAAEGDAEAIDTLRAKAAAEILLGVGYDLDGLSASEQAVLDSMMGLASEDLVIGATLDNTQFGQSLWDAAVAAEGTVGDIQSMFENLGWEPEITTEQIPMEAAIQQMSGSGFVDVVDPLTGEVTRVTTQEQMEGMSTSGMIEVVSINGNATVYKGGGGSASKPSGGGGGGGGGGKPKKAEKVKKSDVVERYKEINDKLDDIQDKMEDASKAADRLWGPARLEQMKKVNAALEDEIDALKKKRKEAQDNLIIDKKALKDTIKEETGIKITDADFDKNGNFIKYDEILTDLYEDLDTTIAQANADGNADEDENEAIQEIQDKIDKVKDAISQYDETRELIEDLDNDIQDKIYQWQDNNYEQLNYKLELEIEINDAEMERLEYYLGKTEGNIYKTAEAFTKMKEITDVYNDNLSNQAQYVADLEDAYEAGEISLDAYKEGLRESQSATIENLQALQEQKEAMQDYYGEVMDMALEEIALYTDEMEELNSVLDHYSNILELVGKQEDYATKGKVLQSKATNLRNEMQVQQKLYEESNAEAEKWAEKMANAVEGSNEYETYKKNWIAAQEAANEAQDNMLSKTEEWAEAMKAVVENELADLAHTMEESLTGGTSFDELLTSMERRSSLQEEYLTTTNQIYETNKLMRQAQQEIDKTTNSAAKRRLQGFINETAHMQDQNKLSQYELDIQQAKYDLLLAEIALEEAQNAKSTVRLQRDSEGNFGYVYTADSSAVAEAEQELADKQNALYNLGLEGANDYSQKYAETMQEAQDAITELTEMWMNGEIESEEEFQRRKAEIQDYYYEKLKQYSNLYQVALTTDSNVIKDAWSSDFNDMMYKTEEWKGAVDEYFVGAAESMQTWAEVCATVLSESGLDDISTKVGEIDQKSQDLKTTLIGEDGESGVVGAMMSEVEAAGKLSEAYVGIQNEIDKLIEKYEKLLEKVNEDYTNPDTEVVDPAIDPDEEEEEEEPTPPAPDPDPPAPELKVGSKVMVKKSASRWASGSSIWDPVKGNNFKVKQIKGDTVLIGDPCGPNYSASGYTGWIKKSDLEGFDTGGYTGSWGSYGKLAMLHEKELVLNAHDTDNFLNTMEVMERILQMLDLQTMSSQLGGILSSPTLRDPGNQVIEQHIEIEANFPEATDRFEIEEAFKSMANLASQYANRK